MYLESIATALPPYRFTQPECLEALREAGLFERLRPGSGALLGKVLANGASGIGVRHFCLPEIAPVIGRGAQELNEFFEREAPSLAAAALAPALEKASLRATGVFLS